MYYITVFYIKICFLVTVVINIINESINIDTHQVKEGNKYVLSLFN